jgi:hypothetical protein
MRAAEELSDSSPCVAYPIPKVVSLKYLILRIGLLALCLALLAAPMVIVRGAGGRIEGKVTDPKGAAVVGAIVTVTDPASGQTFSATTDKQGHYQIEGLPAGVYSIVVAAPGFSDSRRDDVNVVDGTAATIDTKLEIAPIEATVTAPRVTSIPFTSSCGNRQRPPENLADRLQPSTTWS